MRALLELDKTVKLEINGSAQQMRMCAERTAPPPILIVQAGPGFPLLHEVARFQRRLGLEKARSSMNNSCGRATPYIA
jgi:hypothetical protein